MAINADGSIVINTKIDDVGFSAGMKKITASAHGALNNILFTTVKIGTAIKGMVSGATGLLSGLMGSLKSGLAGLAAGLFIAFALSISKIFAFIRESIQDAIQLDPKLTKQWESIKNSFVELKYAVGNAFLPLVEVAIPYIKQTLSWLIELLNKVAMITAAFVGQKQVLQVVPGSAENLAKSSEKTAKSTEKMKKAAQGALAAFDQINVLQKETAAVSPEAKTPEVATTLEVATQMVPITDDILKKVQEIKDIMADWWADPIGNLQETWGKVKDWFNEHVITPIREWWEQTWFNQNIVEPLKEWFAQAWQNIKDGAAETWAFIKTDFANFVEWFKPKWQKTKEFARSEWADIKQAAHDTWTFIQTDFANLGEWFAPKWEQVKTSASNAWASIKTNGTTALENIKNAWNNAAPWFTTNVIDPLKEKFATASDWIKTKFGGIFDGISGIVRNTFNGMIDLINKLLNRISMAINNMAGIVNQFSWFMGFQIPTVQAPVIPHLATGAVIPPNAEFLAVLGDQKSGKNIEAPAAEFEAMLKRAVENSNGGEVTVTMPVYLDNELIYKGQKRVSMRHGNSLLSGGQV